MGKPTKTLVCYRPGRDGFKVGDTIEIPADVEFFDRVTFRELGDKETDPFLQEPAPADEGSLQAQLDAADNNSDEDDSDKAEVND